MQRVLVGGDWAGAFELLAPLYGAGYRLTLAPDDRLCDCALPHAPGLVLLVLDGDTLNDISYSVLNGRPLPWIGWNRHDDSRATLAAYGAGALTVLPAGLSGDLLLQSVRNALAAVAPSGSDGVIERRYERDDLIALERDAILEVREGIVAQTVIHADGSEVLLGLCGPGQLLIGHPDDSCCLQLLAHTDTSITIRSWSAAASQPHFAERLRARLRQMEAWSAMSARHYLDQRVIGILGLLGEQFGRPQDDGLLIDVRITHAQLATAVGATRTTVTRILSELRARHLLTTVGSGANERFCLRSWEQIDHQFR
jgi:CRP-like cAMP-binding protein